jgi:predicted ATPase/class 3 adenylate cyclase
MRQPPAGTISLLFTDIESSTALARQAGDSWGDVLAAHHAVLREAVERHDGYIDSIEGDAVFATFADARDAVESAIDAQRGLDRVDWPGGIEALRVRMGVHTGFVERRDVGYVSIEVHRAARVGAAAAGGQVLVTAATRALLDEGTELEDLGEHRLKDFPRPERLYHVVYDGRRAERFGPPRTAAARPTNLPEDLAPLLGRDGELARLQSLLSDGTRLVTLVGAGGAGKTRLALAVARQMLDDLAGGAFLVALAPVSDPAEVLPAVARALDLGEDAGELAPRIAQRLGERQALLVLDNFEQILGAGPAVADLLEHSPRLRVLVTSQAPLRVRGETVMALDALEPQAAAALFAERARSAAPGWTPGPDDEAAIAAVCDRVGRLPLAVELAAARASVLTPADLLARLEASSDVLRNSARDAPERHRSLRATFEWTYGLLEPGHQAVFRRLGVFAGPAPLAAAEAVGGEAALDGVEALLDFSLLRRVESPALGWRFLMPQALREFARGELAASGEEHAVRRRHAEHVLAVADAARIWFAATPDRQSQVVALDAEIRPALAWAQAHDPELYRRLVSALGLGLLRRGLIRELIAFCERADDRLDPTGAWLINCHAYALLMAQRLDEAEARLAPAIAYYRSRGDTLELGLALHTLCWIADTRGEERSIAIARESLEHLRRTGDPRLEERGVVALVQTLINSRHTGEAKEAIEAERAVISTGVVSTWWGDIALLEGEPEAAVPHYAASLEAAQLGNDGIQVINDGTLLGVALLQAGELLVGLEIAGAAASLASDVGHGGLGYQTVFRVAETIAEARADAGEAGEEAYARGRGLPPLERVPRMLALARAYAAREDATPRG